MGEADVVRRCISGDSMVTMSNGKQKMIKDIVVGDMVQSFNELGISENKQVLQRLWWPWNNYL